MVRSALIAGLTLFAAKAAAQAPRSVDELCAPPTVSPTVVPLGEETCPPPPPEVPGKPPTLDPVAPVVVSRVTQAGRRIALTFDACSVKHGSQYDEQITQVLKDTATPATIFIGGRWAAEQ